MCGRERESMVKKRDDCLNVRRKKNRWKEGRPKLLMTVRTDKEKERERECENYEEPICHIFPLSFCADGDHCKT